MNAAGERVVIVDRGNRITGSATRGEMRRQGLRHRSTYIFVHDSDGRLFVQKRTLTKDVYPGYWDPAAGGVVLEGESYEEGAVREVAEELGVRGVPLAPQFDFYFEDGAIRVWGRVFSCRWDGALTLQPEEVAGGEWMSIDDILTRSATELFTPDGLRALEKYRESRRGDTPESRRTRQARK